ncbi:hypothetical protein OSTOST_09828 [Ostertagia ostertagi]
MCQKRTVQSIRTNHRSGCLTTTNSGSHDTHRRRSQATRARSSDIPNRLPSTYSQDMPSWTWEALDHPSVLPESDRRTRICIQTKRKLKLYRVT